MQARYKKEQLDRLYGQKRHHRYGQVIDGGVVKIKVSTEIDGVIVFCTDSTGKKHAIIQYWSDERACLVEFSLSGQKNLLLSVILRSNITRNTSANFLSGVAFNLIAGAEVDITGADELAAELADASAETGADGAVPTIAMRLLQSVVVAIAFDTKFGRRCVGLEIPIHHAFKVDDNYRSKWWEVMSDEQKKTYQSTATILQGMNIETKAFSPAFGNYTRTKEFHDIELIRTEYIADYGITTEQVQIDEDRQINIYSKGGIWNRISQLFKTTIIPLGFTLILSYGLHVFVFGGSVVVNSLFRIDARDIEAATKSFELKTNALARLMGNYVGSLGIRYVDGGNSIPVKQGENTIGDLASGEMVYAVRASGQWVYVISGSIQGWVEDRYLRTAPEPRARPGTSESIVK